MSIQEFRLAVLQNAIADIGKGEEGENNWGPYVKGLLDGVNIDFPASWCAAAVWNWIESAIGFENHFGADILKITRLETPSAKAMYNACRELGWLVTDPQPGDLVFFKRPGENWYAHVGIVEDVSLKDQSIGAEFNKFRLIRTIEGNKGPFPAKVRRYEYTTPIADLLGYVRLLGE